MSPLGQTGTPHRFTGTGVRSFGVKLLRSTDGQVAMKVAADGFFSGKAMGHGLEDGMGI